MIELTKGNSWQAPAEALVNTVNTAGIMGKGIALQFKQAYPQMFRAYERDCKAGEVKLGKDYTHEPGAPAQGEAAIEGAKWGRQLRYRMRR